MCKYLKMQSVGFLILINSILFSQNSSKLSTSDKVYGLSKFWQEANYNFVNFDCLAANFNWDSVYKSKLEEVIRSKNDYQYYKTLENFAALLNDGHTEVYYQRNYMHLCNYPKIAQHNIGKKVYVSVVVDSLKDIIPLGSQIVEVEGLLVEDYLKKHIFPYISASTEQHLWQKGVEGMFLGLDSTCFSLTILKPNNKRATIRLERDAKNYHPEGFEKIKYFLPAQNLHKFKWLGNHIAYYQINGFVMDSINSYLKNIKKLEEAKAIILDLRNNSGGASPIADSILSLLASPYYATLGWKTKEHNAAYKAWGTNGFMKEYERYYNMKAFHTEKGDTVLTNNSINPNVPIICLTSTKTASSAENFILQFSISKNKPIIMGEPTAGTTGQPLVFELPENGWARICSKRNTMPNGADFINKGINPDFIVYPTVENLINNEDVVLDSAINLIKSKLNNYEN